MSSIFFCCLFIFCFVLLNSWFFDEILKIFFSFVEENFLRTFFFYMTLGELVCYKELTSKLYIYTASWKKFLWSLKFVQNISSKNSLYYKVISIGIRWMKHFFVYKTEPGYLIKLMESTTTKKEKKYPRKIIYSKNSNKIHNIFNYWVLLILEDINFHGFKEYVNSLRLF